MEEHKLWRKVGGEAETIYLAPGVLGAIDAVRLDDCEVAFEAPHGAWSRISTSIGRTYYYAGEPSEAFAYLKRATLFFGGPLAQMAAPVDGTHAEEAP